jgi:hypothetical protein
MAFNGRKKREIDNFIVSDAEDSASQFSYMATPIRRQRLSPHAPVTEGSSSRPSSPIEEVESDTPGAVLVAGPRPRRGAAVSAAPQIRSYARRLIQDVSDIEDGSGLESESEDSVESDDGRAYAPFETQIQAALDRELTDQELAIPDCEDVGTLPGSSSTQPSWEGVVRSSQRTRFVLLVEATLNEEHRTGSKFGTFFSGEAHEYWTDMSMLTLCSMHRQVIHEITYGSLKKAAEADSELRIGLDLFALQGRNHPCIYICVHTDQQGNAMKLVHARRLVKWLQRYTSEE